MASTGLPTEIPTGLQRWQNRYTSCKSFCRLHRRTSNKNFYRIISLPDWAGFQQEFIQILYI